MSLDFFLRKMAPNNKTYFIFRWGAQMVCEFCSLEFGPRPQVKHPRACSAVRCQQQRQRSNENDWRDRQTDTGSGTYQAVQRESRKQAISRIIGEILRCLGVGRRLAGLSEFNAAARVFLDRIFLRLGIRVVNKFWSA